MHGKPYIILTAGTGAVALSLISTGDKAFLPIVEPMHIVEIGVVIVTLGTGNLAVDFDKRVTAGSDTGRVNQGIGAVSKAAASLAAGKVLRKFVNQDVEVGDELVVEVTTALTTTGTGIVYVKGYGAGRGGLEADDVVSD